MKPTIQLGTHPDAESLTAFAEQLLSGAEREQILAHMATCGRCREVVFLTQQMMEPEKPALVIAPQESLRGAKRGWFVSWRWAWVPAAALAGFVGFAVVQHQRRAGVSQPEMAQNVSPPETVRNARQGKAAATPPVQLQAPRREEAKEASKVRGRAGRDAAASSGIFDQKDKATQRKDELAKKTDGLSAVSAEISDGAAQPSPTARAKAAFGGPMAQNQMQQNNAQLQQQNYADEVRPTGTLSNSANKPAPASVPANAASEGVAVQAEPQPALASKTPVTSAQLATAPLRSGSIVVTEKKLGKTKEAQFTLPSGLGVLSQASLGSRRIALDTAGSLFFTEDSGQSWQPEKAQWTGRAVLVKARSSGQVTGTLLGQKAARFELVTDKLETWISTDGKTWTVEAPAVQ
jgi:hypothetical protein